MYLFGLFDKSENCPAVFPVKIFILEHYEHRGQIWMNITVNTEFSAMDGNTYIVGREGHIYIGDSSVSREHAEIKFIDGRIRLRDLSSANGIYLVKNNKVVRFQEGYVKPRQPILIGKQQCTIQSLLAVLGIFTDHSEHPG